MFPACKSIVWNLFIYFFLSQAMLNCESALKKLNMDWNIFSVLRWNVFGDMYTLVLLLCFLYFFQLFVFFLNGSAEETWNFNLQARIEPGRRLDLSTPSGHFVFSWCDRDNNLFYFVFVSLPVLLCAKLYSPRVCYDHI